MPLHCEHRVLFRAAPCSANVDTEFPPQVGWSTSMSQTGEEAPTIVKKSRQRKAARRCLALYNRAAAEGGSQIHHSTLPQPDSEAFFFPLD